MQSDRNGSVSIDMDTLSRDQQGQMQLIEQQVSQFLLILSQDIL